MKKNYIWIFLLGILILILSLFLFLWKSSPAAAPGVVKKGTPAVAELSKYDGHKFGVSSADGKIAGTVGLTAQGGYLHAQYLLLIKDALPENCGSPLACSFPTYNYGNNLDDGKDEHRPQGSISPAYCHKDELSDPFDPDWQLHSLEGCGLTTPQATDVFASEFSQNFSSYEEFVSYNVLNLIKITPVFYQEQRIDAGTSYTIDFDRAMREGEKVRTYVLDISGQ